jgi:hypothetical protein
MILCIILMTISLQEIRLSVYISSIFIINVKFENSLDNYTCVQVEFMKVCSIYPMKSPPTHTHSEARKQGINNICFGIVHHIEFFQTQCLGNWICFHHQV